MRDKQAIFAVVGVILVVAAFIVGANVLTNRTTPAAAPVPTSSASASPSDGATATPTPTAKPKVLAGCTAVPKAVSTPKKLTGAPDLAAAKGKTFTATLDTTCGPITAELDGTKAPIAVSSFLFLSQQDYYASSPCHRLTGQAQGIYVLQCGDPTGTGSGPGPGYHYGVENAPANDVYPAGTLAMARKSGDPNSNADQFFIVYKATTLPKSGDGSGYTVFGKVTAGLDIVDKIAAAGINPTDKTSPLAPISLTGTSVKVKG
ncbi:MAG: peptidylprolyl isomerase [Actinomycetota bacterium]|nr:peptidylprolyl isomerase [Actinomycetota bacterium]